jgi:hypothetical protein
MEWVKLIQNGEEILQFEWNDGRLLKRRWIGITSQQSILGIISRLSHENCSTSLSFRLNMTSLLKQSFHHDVRQAVSFQRDDNHDVSPIQ